MMSFSVNDGAETNTLYKNPKKFFLRDLMIVILGFIFLIISSKYVTEYFNLMFDRSITSKFEKGKITIIFVCTSIFATFCVCCIYFFIKRIHNYRDIIISEKGILKYWLLPFVCRDFVPFSSIAAYYITELDFENIQKKLNQNDSCIVPLVNEVGDLRGFSKELYFGNELVVITKDRKVHTYFNIDNTHLVFDLISLRTNVKQKKSSSAAVSNHDTNAADPRNEKIFITDGSTGEIVRSRNIIAGVSKNLIYGFITLCFVPTITCIISGILCYFIEIETLFSINFVKFWIYWQAIFVGLFLLACCACTFLFPGYYKANEILFTTDNRLVVTNRNNEIKYSCKPSEIKSCQLHKYILFKNDNGRDDWRYRLEIITKNDQTYTLEKIYPEQAKQVVRALNMLFLTAKGAFDE